MTTNRPAKSDTTIARMVGVLFLLSTITYIVGSGLTSSLLKLPDFLEQAYPNKTQLISGVLLQFVNNAAVVGIGVLLFPIVKRYSERVALGYVVTRLLECLLLLIGGLGILSLITLSQHTNYADPATVASAMSVGGLFVAGSALTFQVAMIALSIGSLPLCYLLYRTALIPRSLAALGVIGYATLLIGSILELFGFTFNMLHFVPGGLFEFILPLWLLIKGFNTAAVVAAPATLQSA